MILAIVMGLAKAFDTINHSIFLSRLDSYGIKGMAFQWLESYLSNRPQISKVGKTLSDQKAISCGVPQGLVLVPLLFLTFMNDITKLSSQPKLIT